MRAIPNWVALIFLSIILKISGTVTVTGYGKYSPVTAFHSPSYQTNHVHTIIFADGPVLVS